MNRRMLLTSIAAGALTARAPARAQAVARLRVVGAPVDAFKVVYYAINAGLFSKYGVAVEASMLGGGAASAAALVGGSVDIAGVSALTLFQAHLRGVAMQYVVPSILLTSDRPTTQTLVLNRSGIRTGRDLNGKTIGSTTVGDINAAATLAWIDATGGDSKTVKVIEVPADSAEAFLEMGRADAVTLNEPIVSEVLAYGNARSVARPYDAIGKRLEVSGWTAMRPFIQANADTIVRFERAMHEAQVYTNTHDAQTVDIVAGFTGIPASVIARSIRMRDPEYLEVDNLQPLIDTLARYSFLSASFPASDVISPTALKPS